MLTTLDGYFNSINSTLNDSSLGFVNTGTDTGTANNYLVPTLAFGAFSSYNQGSTILLVPTNTNTGASTLTVSSLGSAPIVSSSGAALTGGELIAGRGYTLTYFGTSFQMTNVNSGFGTGNFTPILASQSFNCDGYFSLHFNCTFQSAIAGELSLLHLPQGVLFTVLIQNSTGSIGTLSFVGSTMPNGTAYNANAIIVNPLASSFQTVLTCPPGKGVLATLKGIGNAITGVTSQTL